MAELSGIGLIPEREVFDRNLVDPCVDGDDGGSVEEAGEDLRVERCRGDDDLEFGAAGCYLLQKSQDEVDVEAAFVGLVDHDDAVAAEVPVGLELLKQHAIGEDLDARVDVGRVVEAHLVGAEVLRKSFAGYLALDV